ncbi:hypothetical protein AVEN_35417-1 [Araneus ventricosus]|uniref:Reverse transcriptase domain-containing protein n=1 Tax=Araneus ventricosus TaxID=182803 RepID=A0A4Y2NQ92_ARAVE|nr:hypothetical protein AVEN_35417-1 [Araneus ventricosus]
MPEDFKLKNPLCIAWSMLNLMWKAKCPSSERRLQKSRGEDRIHYKTILSKKRVLFKKAVKRAQRGSWRLLSIQAQILYGLQTTLGHLSNNGKERERKSHIIRAVLYPQIAPRAIRIQPHQSLFEEEKLSQQEIDDIVEKIPNGKAPGYDGIDNIIVKVIFNFFPSLLLDFFNKCLELKCFPDPLNIGLVIMFQKTGKEEQNIKYRPISLLPTLDNLLEKLLLQIFNFQLKTIKLQHPLQLEFREGKSADDALLHVTSLLE